MASNNFFLPSIFFSFQKCLDEIEIKLNELKAQITFLFSNNRTIPERKPKT